MMAVCYKHYQPATFEHDGRIYCPCCAEYKQLAIAVQEDKTWAAPTILLFPMTAR